jgi:hemerythrin superfamily protein
MGFIKNLMERFKKNEVMAIENLNYSPNLITMLQSDHQQLFEIYRTLQTQYKIDNSFGAMESLINEFKLAFELHLMMEDTQLYGYLRAATLEDSDNHALVNEMQEQMNPIIKKIIKLIHLYSDEKSYQKNVDKLLDDLGAMGMILTQRFNTEEEKLYPLYKEV